MPLTLHHLTKSQSERILFLLEELSLPFKLIVHERDPKTALSPPSLKSLHPTGTAPLLIDEPPNPNSDSSPVVLTESTACVEYIISTYAPSSALRKNPGDPHYAAYLSFLHYANGTLQPTLGRLMMLSRAGVADDSMPVQFVSAKLPVGLGMMEEQLGRTSYLAGDDLTAADIMCFFTLTTMRGFCPVDYAPYPNLLRYLQTVAARPAYKKTMARGDEGLEPLLGAQVEKFKFG